MKELNKLVTSLQDLFAKRLLSVFIFGSKANAVELPLDTNVDLFIILDNVRGDDLTKLYPYVMPWVVKGNPAPIILGKDEFMSMTDIYAIEMSDIKWNNQLLYGEDLAQNLNINYFDLRIQCERELKNMVLRLRSSYLETGKSKSAILGSINNIAKTIVVLFRAILRLKNIAPAVYKLDLVEQLGTVIRFDQFFFKKIIGQKEGTYKLSTSELYEFNEYLINQLISIIKQVSAI